MIVIPMAGLSSRFKKAGYIKPKYMLEVGGETLFSLSVKSFSRYFNSEFFLFITLNQSNIKEFIQQECEFLGVIKYRVVVLNQPTDGQAETVYRGLKKLNLQYDSDAFIFNIDTFRLNFIKPKCFDLKAIDGYLETFIGSGANWSNVVPEKIGSNKVKLTAEKREISKFCCTGLYYWKSIKMYCEVFNYYRKLGVDNMQGKEYYIAPMYNYLIEEGYDVRFNIIKSDQVIFCGTPDEYDSYIQRNKKIF